MATNVKIIDPMTAYEWLQNDEVVVVDVREPGEYKEVHIPGAYCYNLATLVEERSS